MKRDMDLVRHILLIARESETAVPYSEFCVSDGRWSKELILYHMEIMKEHGLIDATVTKASGGIYFDGSVKNLTWEGQDFCDSIADDRASHSFDDPRLYLVPKASFQVTVQTITKVANELIEGI